MWVTTWMVWPFLRTGGEILEAWLRKKMIILLHGITYSCVNGASYESCANRIGNWSERYGSFDFHILVAKTFQDHMRFFEYTYGHSDWASQAMTEYWKAHDRRWYISRPLACQWDWPQICLKGLIPSSDQLKVEVVSFLW